MNRIACCVCLAFALSGCMEQGFGQSLGNAGTVTGMLTDASGAVIPDAIVSLSNRLTNYSQKVAIDASGTFRFTNVPPNSYHLEATAQGFTKFTKDLSIRSTVPMDLKIKLEIAENKTSVTVEAAGSDVLENVSYAHNDVDMKSMDKLPISSPGAGLSDAIAMNSGAVASDSNGFFHPLGDHAQTSFSIDGQPVNDQQSKQFSTQIPLNAIQSMELITGAPPAEFGDKTSLVINAVTRSGLGQKLNGSVLGQWGSFGTYAEESTLSFGTAKVGNFIAANVLRSGRFLDTPEYTPIHAIGNNFTVFDRFDYQPSGKDAIHLNLFSARNWFQIPNTYDQLTQDQRQRITSFNVAPGYQHTFSSSVLFTVTPFFRADRVNYTPSRDVFADTPATLAQQRSLSNWGAKADISYVHGRHNIKVGVQAMQTRLHENFSMGLTDYAFNPVCLNNNGDPLQLPNVANPRDCAKNGAVRNFDLLPGLVPYDLTRGGKLFQFTGAQNINQASTYIQDSIKFGDLQVQAGLRFDHYDGLTSNNGVQPRFGLSYLMKSTGTVLRAAYSRTFETPYNENLILSSGTGVGGLATNVFGGQSVALVPGTRNQFNAGLQQTITKHLMFDADYFWKFTTGAYDFDTLFNTPIQFPIQWKKSKIDGVSARIASLNIKGFQWITTMGHTRARYFGPETGGLIFNSGVSNSVFRIDHDQAFQQTTQLRYQKGANGPWAAFTWRYDSGLIAGAVGSLEDALALSGAQQAAIGFYCGNQLPSINQRITNCMSSNYGATRLAIPPAGTLDADSHPSRVAPRNLFDLGVGTDNLLHKEHYRTILKFTVSNITNKVALYNFLSTFSGTHFVPPRSYQVVLGFVF